MPNVHRPPAAKFGVVVSLKIFGAVFWPRDFFLLLAAGFGVHLFFLPFDPRRPPTKKKRLGQKINRFLEILRTLWLALGRLSMEPV